LCATSQPGGPVTKIASRWIMVLDNEQIDEQCARKAS
jgi:hypothetical protein